MFGFTIACLYPIVLMPTFRSNRADYEFRLFHWFPAGIFVLWMLFQVIDPYWEWFHILNLGFFSFWSLPVVALGLGLGAAFSIHVLRRRNVRVTLLTLLLVAFTVGAALAETTHGVNQRLQAKIFTGNPVTSLRPVMTRVRSLLVNLRYPQSSGSTIIAVGSSSSSVSSRSARSQISTSSVASSVIAEHTPNGLPKSGPEALMVLFATLVALYTGTLHVRGKKRA